MSKGNMLKNPINIGDLLHGGTEFQIDTDFKDDEDNDNFLEDDYGSADEDEETYKQLLTPWNRGFDELRQEMEPVSTYIHKRVMKPGVGELLTGNVRVVIDYNAFFEKEIKPFDSTTLREKPFQFTFGAEGVLPGLDQAVQTMRVSEESQFLISYQLLFGELGCMPRVKPKADALFVIRLLRYSEVGDSAALSNLDEKERRSYAVVKEKVAEIRKYAKDCFQRNLLPNAINKYLEAVDSLHLCQLMNEEEQREQQDTLLSLYTSLAVCYNRKDQPKEACRMVNEARRLCDINQHPKILYQEGKALYKLGDYDRSRKSLLRAQKLEPRDEFIQQTLKELNETSEKHKKEEQKIWSRALGMVTKKQVETSREEKAFLDNVKESMELFLNDEKCNTLPLPDGLSEKEVSILQNLADEFELKLNVHVNNNKKHYKFQK